MAEKDQGAKAVIQLRPADWIAYVLPGTEYQGPLETDVATEPQLMLDTLARARYQGMGGVSKSKRQKIRSKRWAL